MIFLLLLFIPPLNINIEPTSTFGEYRPLRFHMGIDISTHGKEGLPVYAVRRGQIERVKNSFFGYGKVLYLRHRDGTISVYAHLSRFMDEIESIIYQKQIETQRYEQDIHLNPPVSVEEGTVIGYSGQTGAGLPHLHFELRTFDNLPFNPLYHLPKVRGLPPLITEIILHPYQGGMIDNLPVEQVFKSPFKEIPTIKGKFRISIGLRDSRNSKLTSLGIRKVKLLVNDSVYFDIEMDTLSYEMNNLSEMLYEYKGSRFTNSRIRLYKIRDIPILSKYFGYPYMELPPGEYKISPLIEDPYGNIRKSELKVRVEKEILRNYYPLHRIEWDYKRSSGDDTLYLKFEEEGILILENFGGSVSLNGNREFPLYKDTEKTLFFVNKPGILEISIGNEKFIIKLILVDSTGTTVYFKYLKLTIEPQSLFEPQFLFIFDGEKKVGNGELFGGGEPVYIAPLFPEVTKKLTLQVEHGNKSGIYHFYNKKWSFIGIEEGKTITLGEFSTFRDTTPPSVSFYTLGTSSIQGKITDLGSGVDANSINCIVDNRWLPTEFDPEIGRFKVNMKGIPESERHTIVLRVMDRVGNLRRVERAFF